MNKSKFFKIMTVVLLVAGVCVLFYPAVVNIIFVAEQNKVVDEYNRQVQELEQSNIDTLKQQAQEYNDRLAGVVSHSDSSDSDSDQSQDVVEYGELLNVSGNQMGYVVIPEISVNLPIYHYSTEAVLSVGVGHLENTSLPVGGTNTHSVLTGHTGLPGAKIFTDLEKLEVGDVFYIKALDETLCYEVDQIKVVLPNDASDLQIIEGRDLVTLFTCTPYGVNSHRLLVRGSRIAYDGSLDEDSDIPKETVPSTTQEASAETSAPFEDSETLPAVNPLLEKSSLSDEFILKYIVLPSFIALAVIALVIIMFRKKGKKNER